MSRMTPLLDRNEQFARAHTPTPLARPAVPVIVLACLDHRVDPAIVLGLRLGDSPVIRNAGGRVTPAVIDDVAYLVLLAERLVGGAGTEPLLEVAVIQHTQCGTGLLTDPDFLRQAVDVTGRTEADLMASVVTDPSVSVKADVERLLTAPTLAGRVSVSGHVHDLTTGRVTTIIDASVA